jgi:signal transduction histidine kinase
VGTGGARRARMLDVAARTSPPRERDFWRNLWVRTALRGAVLVVAYFGAWEVMERMALVRGAVALHALHLVRGMGAAFMLATWSFLQIRRSRLECDIEMDEQMSHLERRVQERTRELEDARAFTELLFNSLRERIVVHDTQGNLVKTNRVAAQVTDADDRVWERETIAVPEGFVIEVGRDVTEQRNLEAQVKHQEKMASLGILAAGFAHDLGNPLASLSTELELLEGEDDLPRIRESLGVLRSHVSRMIRTLREMVDFARRRRDEVTDVSIALAVADSARLVCHDPRWQKVQLVMDVPVDLPSVRLVEDHLVLVLVNLMLNAADAMPHGGSLTVLARHRAGHVELRLKDSGTGMSPDVLAKALTPLFTTKAHGRGTGLGLAVSNSIVKSIGGSLRLESTPGVGTEVLIDLPAPSGGGDG